MGIQRDKTEKRSSRELFCSKSQCSKPGARSADFESLGVRFVKNPYCLLGQFLVKLRDMPNPKYIYSQKSFQCLGLSQPFNELEIRVNQVLH